LRRRAITGWIALAIFCALTGALAQVPADQASAGEPGMSSPGSPGMEEQGEPAFTSPVVAALKKYGAKSSEYMCALLDLGMYYNRHERHAEAVKVLTESLALADGGLLLKMAPKTVPKKPPAPTKQFTSADGQVVGIENVDPQSRDIQFLEGILPALVEAEMAAKKYALAEVHVKRLIAVSQKGSVADKVALMGAYWQYSELLKRLGRKAEAAQYKKKGDDINASFIPL
jgi:hypothetical protein